MNARIPAADFPEIVYPDSDGQPMSDNMLQFHWIVTIKENLDLLFRDRADVLVAGDLLWYPVEHHPEIRQAPDALVVFGRPKGFRGSYRQWDEEGVSPQVVFEVLSPGNRAGEMLRKREFYERYGVEEYYVYDPDRLMLQVWRRVGAELSEIEETNGWESPRLGIRFVLEDGPVRIYRPDGRLFLTYDEIDQERQEERRAKEEAQQLAEQVRQEKAEAVRVAEQDRQAAEEAKRVAQQARQGEAEAKRVAEQDRQAASEAHQREAEAKRSAEQDRQAAEEYRQRILRLEEQLRAAGLHPE